MRSKGFLILLILVGAILIALRYVKKTATISSVGDPVVNQEVPQKGGAGCDGVMYRNFCYQLAPEGQSCKQFCEAGHSRCVEGNPFTSRDICVAVGDKLSDGPLTQSSCMGVEVYGCNVDVKNHFLLMSSGDVRTGCDYLPPTQDNARCGWASLQRICVCAPQQ